MTCRCGAALHPDPHPAELRAGKLGYRCHAGHRKYVDVPPVQTEAEALLDAAVAGLIERREMQIEARGTCDTCGKPMLQTTANQKRHPRCLAEAERRKRRQRDTVVGAR